MNYWEPSTDFEQGAGGACDAAKDLGFNYEDVAAAFSAVDVTHSSCGTAREKVKIFKISDSVSRSEAKQYGLISVDDYEKLVVQVTGSGDGDLYVKLGAESTTSCYDCRP